VGAHVIRNPAQQRRRSLRGLTKEGFRHVHVLSRPEEIAELTIERRPLWTDRRNEAGPFDIIGDVHGCYEELVELLQRLGYVVHADGDHAAVAPPEGRRAIFLGDLVDRGPATPSVLRLAMAMSAAGRGGGDHAQRGI
jgi:protein phosphatase